jgi:hypothetical protein
VEVHAAAAADDGRARFLVHAVEVVQPNPGCLAGGNGDFRRANQQGRFTVAAQATGREPRLAGPGFGILLCGMAVAVEAVLVEALVVLDLDQPDVEFGILVGSKSQCADDEHGAKNGIRLHVVHDRVTLANQNGIPDRRQLATVPGLRFRPVAGAG